MMNVWPITLYNRRFVVLVVITAAFLMASSVTGAQEDNPLPAPTGPHEVGVVWRHWVDDSRDEIYDAETSDAKREVIVGFYYPAEVPEGAEPAPYMDNLADVIPTFNALIEAFVAVRFDTQPSDLDNFQSYSYPDAPLSDAEETYPVLIFSHGGAADVRMYTSQIEELASHGYIVVAINHVYGAAYTTLRDGTAAIPTYSTGLEDAVRIWSEDQIFVMDQLELLNTDDPEGMFTGRLDLERLGVFGQSMGGGTASLTCSVDQRCKAFVSGDAAFMGDAAEQGLEQPVMHLRGESAIVNEPGHVDQARGPFYEVAVDGFEHLNFGDFPLWPNVEGVREAAWLSEADPLRSIEVTRAALVAFFDQYLKGSGEASMDDLSTYPEVTVTTNNVE
jgi:pimeloyl-ACP methyl ester carboxylesterase